MFLEILLFPIETVVLYALPLLGAVFAEKNHAKWLSHFLITVFMSIFISPVLSLLFSAWIVQFIFICISGGLLLTFNNDKAQQLFKLVTTGVQIVQEQVDMIKQKALGVMKQYELLQ